MSNYSEKILQRSLHQAKFYTQKAPSSGVGILDPETEEHIDQADIVAIRADPQLGAYDGHISLVWIIEEKHVQPPTCPIQDEEKQQLKRIQEITGGVAYIAVKWKYREGDHQFFHIDDLQDTGMHWKLTEDQEGESLDEILP